MVIGVVVLLQSRPVLGVVATVRASQINARTLPGIYSESSSCQIRARGHCVLVQVSREVEPDVVCAFVVYSNC
jgi:hypothetical protein